MLYQLGAVTIDTAPFSIDSFERDSGASIVSKPVIGGRERKEFTGEGDDTITLSGQILPFNVGGLTELEVLQDMRRRGQRFPLMRGDGYRFGWYALTEITESHTELDRNGIGHVVNHKLTMQQCDFDTGDGQQVVSALLGLFGVLGRL